LNIDDIEQLTIQHGEAWGYPHVRRVLRLADQIGVDVPHDQTSLQYAAYLHDWGAFPRYRQPGVDHALRSKHIAETEVLPHTHLSPAAIAATLEAIALHDYRNELPTRSPEALLLREADCLDFLGAIGIAREFAWGPNDLRKCYERLLSRVKVIRGRLTLPRAVELAEQRFAEIEIFAGKLVEESFGYL